MDRRNLDRTYMKKTGVKQVIEDLQKPTPQIVSRPVSAGGQSTHPATLSQEYLMFILGTDEVPSHLRESAWALATRMNQLTIIDSDFDFERMMHGVRAMLRSLMWERKISLLEMNQLEYYVGVQLRRSRSGKQLRLVAPGYQQILHQEETTKDSVIDGAPNSNSAIGVFGGKSKQGGFR
jgi:hypothetical protein